MIDSGGASLQSHDNTVAAQVAVAPFITSITLCSYHLSSQPAKVQMWSQPPFEMTRLVDRVAERASLFHPGLGLNSRLVSALPGALPNSQSSRIFLRSTLGKASKGFCIVAAGATGVSWSIFKLAPPQQKVFVFLVLFTYYYRRLSGVRGLVSMETRKEQINAASKKTADHKEDKIEIQLVPAQSYWHCKLPMTPHVS